MDPGRPKAEADWETLADRYLREFEVRVNTPNNGRSPDIFVYGAMDEGLYSFGSQEIRRTLKTWAKGEGSQIRQQALKEVLEHISDLAIRVPNELINGDPERLHLENGILNLKTMEVETFSPDHFSTVKIPVKFDPEAECPNFKKFLIQILPNDPDRLTLWEFIAFNLLKSYPYHKALLAYGGGRNGKSTLFDIVSMFLGTHNVAGKEIYEFLQRFGTDSLFGKLANISSDLPAKKITNSAAWKRLFGDFLSAQRKNQSDLVFKNFAKFWISCNELFEVEDQTEAWYRRWIIIQFNQRFVEGAPGYIPRDQLISMCTTDEEKSGILNESLKALNRLSERGKFTNDKGVESVSMWWTQTANPLGEFANKYVEITGDTKDFIQKTEFSHAFRFISKKHMSPQQINTRVQMYLRGVTQGTRKIETKDEDGKAHTNTREVWRGMKWNESGLIYHTAIADQGTKKPTETLKAFSENELSLISPENETFSPKQYHNDRLAITASEAKVLYAIQKERSNNGGIPVPESKIQTITGVHANHLRDIIRTSHKAGRLERTPGETEPAYSVTKMGLQQAMECQTKKEGVDA